MHIDITPENLLIQLDYPVNDATLSQMKTIFATTKNFGKLSKHLLSLHDELQHVGGYVAMSNSHNYLKVKTDIGVASEIDAFKRILDHWSKKYKVALRHVEGTDTFYITAQG